MRKISLSSETYLSDVRPLSAQRLMNVYPEIGPQDGKHPFMLQFAAGLRLFSDTGEGPVRGIHKFNNAAYVVSGLGVYKISSSGAATRLGDVDGTGIVSMTDNGLQLVIVTEPGTGWVVENDTVFRITDPDFLPASSVTFLDQYAIFSRKDTGNFFISALADATSFDALDIATAETSPDNLLKVIADQRQLWLYGTSSIEVWYNSGGADFPFTRFNDIGLDEGTLQGNSVAKIDNTQIFLGVDLALYSIRNYTPIRISTHAMESAIRGYSNPENCYAFTYSLKGHKTYVITWPGQGTWCYDFSTKKLYERRSYGRDSWRALSVSQEGPQNAIYIFNRVLIGDETNGNVYELTLDENTENGTVIERIFTTPNFYNNGDNLYFRRLQLDLLTGKAPLSGQGSVPEIIMEYSVDEGFNFSNAIRRKVGLTGQYKNRVVWDTPILDRNLIFRWTVTDPIGSAAVTAYGDWELGVH